MVLTLLLIPFKNHVKYTPNSGVDLCVGLPLSRFPEFVFLREPFFDVESREGVFDISTRSPLVTGMNTVNFSKVL